MLIAGVGAVGHHLVTDLARAGIGRLDLVDGDAVEPATACRQLAPVDLAGFAKSGVAAYLVGSNNPYTDFRAWLCHIGDPRPDPVRGGGRRPDAHDRLEQLAARADLVIDATANPAVTRYLAALTSATHTPFLHASATAGAWGGVVVLLTEETGCWACLEHHRVDNTVPVPPADPAGGIAPPGCVQPTFVGTNADIATIAHHGGRLALDRLTGAHHLAAGLHVAALRDPAGTAQPVVWRTTPIPVHLDCRAPHRATALPQSGGTRTGVPTAKGPS